MEVEALDRTLDALKAFPDGVIWQADDKIHPSLRRPTHLYRNRDCVNPVYSTAKRLHHHEMKVRCGEGEEQGEEGGSFWEKSGG